MNDAPSDPRTGRSSSVARLRAAGCVFAEDEARLIEEASSSEAQLDALLRRREVGEPLEQILGWVDFRGLRVQVAPGVFVPRVRTGFVVDAALSLLEERDPGTTVLDLCCGSGAIGRALADERGDLRLLAADVSSAAVACARTNLDGFGEVFEGDLFSALPDAERSRIDVVVVNAPYVPTEAIALMPPEARLHEPAVSLDGGSDGLELHRRIARDAPGWLSTGGAVVIESGREQAPASAAAFAASGFSTRILEDDDRDATVVVARLPRTTRL